MEQMPVSKQDLSKMNETGQRKGKDRRQKNLKIDANGNPIKDRRKVKRRRQIDPTTCERDYSEQEVEFMRAMDEYKRASGRMFPTCSEILEVLTNLGYRQVADARAIYDPDTGPSTESSDADKDIIEEDEEQFV
jgi:hypothetical protein